MAAAVAQPPASLGASAGPSQKGKTAAAAAAAPAPNDDQIDAEVDRFMAQFDEQSADRLDSAEPMVMLAFYKRLLPWRPLYTWLNRDLPHKPSKNFTHREFAFTLQNDVYLRYQSFNGWEDLKREVVRLNPSRFEIGPAYSAKPKDRKTVQRATFKPVTRELVFDIDMSDYDEIRTCCSGKGICSRCWAFIAVAVKVLDEALRSDFGFKHLLWVYSGRRGIHCWISDTAACELADDARKAIVGWMEVVRGSANQAKKVFLGSAAGLHERTLHPSLHRALYGSHEHVRLIGDPGSDPTGPLERAFVKTVLRDQDCFAVRKQWETLLELLPTSSDGSHVEGLRKSWSANPSRSSVLKWSDVAKARSSADGRAQKVWNAAMEDIVLQYTYPRIDSEVSKHLNHLLKSPFVVHPATGRVCVPVDPKRVDAFDPEASAPTAAKLLRELNSFEGKARDGLLPPGTSVPKNDWDKTSLRPFVELFEKHCQGIVRQSVEAQRAANSYSMDF
ncbi:p48 polypeptide of DNA primase [Tilletia horrida]|uniref:DNA primase n=1 Tax=Tilletia horrida TaxID=155126 RepID=A0AAN6GB88_9BASI|nr:p48 polypeptide of DNA primase [Tilletia horrida]KAK0531085.1 p48 polypeptide of DNA primase [Tilletia horrida]